MRTVASTLPHILRPPHECLTTAVLPSALQSSHPTDGKQVNSLRAAQEWEKERPQSHFPSSQQGRKAFARLIRQQRKRSTRQSPRWQADSSGQASSFPRQHTAQSHWDCKNQTTGPERIQPAVRVGCGGLAECERLLLASHLGGLAA